MTTKPRRAEPCPGGWMVEYEIENAYVDGQGNKTSRFEKVFVSKEDMRGSREERLQAIQDARGDPVSDIRDADITAPVTPTKAVWERRAAHFYATWQRWKNTRVEADIRTMAAPFINVLIDTEDAAWNAYMDVLKDWRNAP